MRAAAQPFKFELGMFCSRNEKVRSFSFRGISGSLSPFSNSAAEGDGRISLENELKKGSAGYDVLVLDVFSGDQVPIHILTKEAFEIYLKSLADGGVMAVHISSCYVDLLPVLIQIKNHFNLHTAYIRDRTFLNFACPSRWVLFSRNERFIRQPAIALADSLGNSSPRAASLWTDDYANLLDVLGD